MNWFADRSFIITGGTAGIGFHCARHLVDLGAIVYVIGSNREKGLEAQARLHERAAYLQCDVRSPDDCHRAFGEAVWRSGPVTGVVHSAGILGNRVSIDQLAPEDWAEVMAVNLTGTLNILQAACTRMVQTGEGSIVNIASIVGIRALHGMAPYCASKAAVIQLTKVAALEFVPKALRVNAVCPGSIRSPMLDDLMQTEPSMEDRLLALHPIGRLGEFDDVWGAVQWLLTPQSSFVTGHALPVAGGWEIK